jgi:hypothetical protein
MLQAFYCFVLAVLLTADSVNVQHPVLQGVNFIAGVYFAVMGAVAGWLAARD